MKMVNSNICRKCAYSDMVLHPRYFKTVLRCMHTRGNNCEINGYMYYRSQKDYSPFPKDFIEESEMEL